MVDLSVSLCGLRLDNPVVAASGTFGYGAEHAKYYDIGILGSISFKGTTSEPRFGNETPRIAECPCGMLNSVGLQNPGADAVAEKELPALARLFPKPVIANICGFSAAEYAACAERLAACPQVGIVEVNISCPNVHGGGMSFGTDPAAAAQITRAVRVVTDKPLFIKLTPNVTDITEIARACEAAGADGLTVINTLLGMRIDLRTRRPLLANGTGGLSGSAIFPVALAAVSRVFRAVSIPVMGCGGVASASDVLEMMLAGASAVQVGAENLRNPFACRDIISALPETAEKYGVSRLRDIIGEASRD